jgi:hypothetical protein
MTVTVRVNRNYFLPSSLDLNPLFLVNAWKDQPTSLPAFDVDPQIELCLITCSSNTPSKDYLLTCIQDEQQLCMHTTYILTG